MSCFNMFIVIILSIQIAQVKKAITEAAQTDQPAPDPVETVENASITKLTLRRAVDKGMELEIMRQGRQAQLAPETNPSEAMLAIFAIRKALKTLARVSPDPMPQIPKGPPNISFLSNTRKGCQGMFLPVIT